MALSLIRLRPFDTATGPGRSNERYRRIALTTLSSFAVRGLGAVLGLVTVPIVLSYLGKELFGLWSAITVVIAWASLLDFGIANGLVNLVSRAHGRDDEAAARRYISTALALLLAIAAALAIITTFALPLVPWSRVLAVRGALAPNLVQLSVLGALATFVVGLPLSIVPQVFAGYQRSYVFNVFTMLGTLLGFVAVLAAIRVDASMPWMVVTFGIGPLIASATGLVYALLRIPAVRPRMASVSRRAARALSGRSTPLFLFQIGALAVNETQILILAQRCSLSVVADYSVVMRLYIAAMGMVQMSTSSFLPSFREAWERGDRAWMRAAFGRFLRTRMALATAFGSILVVAGDPLLRLWLGRSDVTPGHGVWATAALMMVVVTWVSAHSDLLTIMDRLWILVGLVFVNGAVTVGLTYLLSPRFTVLGALISTAAITTVAYSWAIPLIARRYILHAR